MKGKGFFIINLTYTHTHTHTHTQTQTQTYTYTSPLFFVSPHTPPRSFSWLVGAEKGGDCRGRRCGMHAHGEASVGAGLRAPFPHTAPLVFSNRRSPLFCDGVCHGRGSDVSDSTCPQVRRAALPLLCGGDCMRLTLSPHTRGHLPV